MDQAETQKVAPGLLYIFREVEKMIIVKLRVKGVTIKLWKDGYKTVTQSYIWDGKKFKKIKESSKK